VSIQSQCAGDCAGTPDEEQRCMPVSQAVVLVTDRWRFQLRHSMEHCPRAHHQPQCVGCCAVPIMDGATACALLCTGTLIAHTVQSGGRCQPRSMCPDFTDLTQSGWTATLGFNSPSLCFGSLNRNRVTPRALKLMTGARAVLR